MTGVAVCKLYIGYFRRCPDRDGLNYWLGRLDAGMPLVDIAQSFFVQPEALAIYGGIAGETLVRRIYQNLFGREPDAAGLAYWLGELANGKPVGRMIVDVISGAQGNDALLVENASRAAYDWTQRQSSVLPFDIDAARAMLASINNWPTPSGANVTIMDERLEPYRDAIIDAVKSGWAQWRVDAGIEVSVYYNPAFVEVDGVRRLASCTPGMEIVTASGQTESGVAHEARTGRDPNGMLPDLKISIQTDIGWLVSTFGQAGLESIMAHECGHAFLREALGTDYSGFLRQTSGGFAFTGPAATAIHGGPVPVVSVENRTHINVETSIMWPYITPGTRVTDLDRAIIRDLGVPVN